MNLLTIPLVLVVIGLIVPFSIASAYEKENHYWLKIALALNCGFDIDTARQIAIGDFGIDEDEDTQPVVVGGDKSSAKWKWHALPTENPDADKNAGSSGNQEIKQRQHELYQRAMKESDKSAQLIKFGQYLHYTEDKWSHWGYTTTFGHGLREIVPGMSPDATHANPDYYRYMVFDSMVNLGKLAKLRGIDTKCESSLVPLDTYKSSPEYGADFPWVSPQEIKRAKDPKDFQKQVEQKLKEWKKSQLIDQNIYYSKEDGAKGVSTNLIKYISTKTGIPVSRLGLVYDFKPIDIDEDGNLKEKPSPQDFGIQRRSGDTLEVEQNQHLKDYPIKLTTQNGFDASVELTVSIEPETKYVEAKIKGKSTLKVNPKKDQNLSVVISADDRAPAGEYKVTVTGKGMIDGKKVTRSTFFVVKVTPPPEILLEVNPNQITIPQGGTGSTTTKFHIKSTLAGTKTLSVGIPKPGFTTKFSGDGKVANYEWNVKPQPGQPNKSKLEVRVAPDVAPGTYTLNVIATFNQEIPIDETYTHSTPTTHTVPLKIHVTAKKSEQDKKSVLSSQPEDKSTSKQSETKPPEPKPSNTKPTLSIPKQVTQEATGPSGAAVTYSVSSQDKEDGTITPTCDRPSGSVFPIGTTTVSCTTKDSNGNSVSGSFTVTVRDTTPPSIPAFQPTEGVRDETGVQVFFTVTARDLVDGDVPASCNYPSGYKFPIGKTVLTCTAVDSRGNQSSRSLEITVTMKESGQ